MYGRSPADVKAYWMDIWENKGELVVASDDDALITLNGPDKTLAVLSENGISLWLEEKSAQEEHWTFYIDQYFMRIPVLEATGANPFKERHTKSLFHHGKTFASRILEFFTKAHLPSLLCSSPFDHDFNTPKPARKRHSAPGNLISAFWDDLHGASQPDVREGLPVTWNF